MNENNTVKQARMGFDNKLHTKEYRKVHEDSKQLENLIKMVEVNSNGHYLDIGTGNGYIAFELVKRFPKISVTGLDIATNSININNGIKNKNRLSNIDFISYDGNSLPFNEAAFYGVISRYAFHHFPNHMLSVNELYRVLESNEFAIISDPITYDEDVSDFIDQFQEIKPDGHIHFFDYYSGHQVVCIIQGRMRPQHGENRNGDAIYYMA